MIPGFHGYDLIVIAVITVIIPVTGIAVAGYRFLKHLKRESLK